jgi:hypothetical protein
MQHISFVRKVFLAATLGLSVATISPQVWADGRAEPMALRKIMRELGKNMQTVTDGISREDWKLVAETAPRIAEHPQPPVGEKMRILVFVGSDAGRFKRFDEKTHQAAKTLEQAAKRGDGQAVVAAFSTLQGNCLACHQNFRKPFVEHFYGQH